MTLPRPMWRVVTTGPRGTRAAAADVARRPRQLCRRPAPGSARTPRGSSRPRARSARVPRRHRRRAARAASAPPSRRSAPRARARARRSRPLRMPPDAITASPARAHSATDTAVGTPQSHSSAPSAAASLPSLARTASTATQLVPPAPDTSTVCTPAPASARAASADSPQPVSLTMIGTGDAATSRAIPASTPRKSRSPWSWTSSCPGFRCTHSASAPSRLTSSPTFAGPSASACTAPMLPSSTTSGATSPDLVGRGELGVLRHRALRADAERDPGGLRGDREVAVDLRRLGRATGHAGDDERRGEPAAAQLGREVDVVDGELRERLVDEVDVVEQRRRRRLGATRRGDVEVIDLAARDRRLGHGAVVPHSGSKPEPRARARARARHVVGTRCCPPPPPAPAPTSPSSSTGASATAPAQLARRGEPVAHARGAGHRDPGQLRRHARRLDELVLDGRPAPAARLAPVLDAVRTRAGITARARRRAAATSSRPRPASRAPRPGSPRSRSPPPARRRALARAARAVAARAGRLGLRRALDLRRLRAHPHAGAHRRRRRVCRADRLRA